MITGSSFSGQALSGIISATETAYLHKKTKTMANQTIKVTGIVIKETKTKENDKIITVLTKELGVIGIYVKGAMRLKNKFHSATGLFTYSEFVLFESRSSELYQLNEATVKHIFHRLSTNVEYLALAMYMSELVCEVTVPDDMNNEILRLFLNMLHMLTTQKWSVSLCKAAFEMRLLSDTGYRPNLVGCKRCGKYETDMFFFDNENGEIICGQCAKSYDKGYYIAEMPTIMALRYLAYADLEKMFTFNITGAFRYQLCRICEKYLLEHTRYDYKTLDFYKSVHIEEKLF